MLYEVITILAYTRNVYLLNDDEVARVRKDGVDVYDKYGIPVQHLGYWCWCG